MSSDERQCGSCGSGRNKTPRERQRDFGPSPGINGVIQLTGWEDCIHPYTGPRRHEDIYVVGNGTDFMRLFDTHSWREVQEYVNSQAPRLRYFRATATQLCESAVRDLYGETVPA